MFDALTDRFSTVFRSLSGRGRISEENIRESMREVRTALLEADVNFQVVNDFVQVVRIASGRVAEVWNYYWDQRAIAEAFPVPA